MGGAREGFRSDGRRSPTHVAVVPCERLRQVIDPANWVDVDRQVECVRQPRPQRSTSAIDLSQLGRCERLEQSRRLVPAW
jgi:hypothetical protein